ncbi:MAG: hypothetical protein KAR42_00645 [candidate division Zixibacteria bacterium]|nr:hypothetical protein [candidate division Zixibacteria bacterium]
MIPDEKTKKVHMTANIISIAFTVAPLLYLVLGYSLTMKRGDDLFTISIPDDKLLFFYLLSAIAIMTLLVGFYFWKKLPRAFVAQYVTDSSSGDNASELFSKAYSNAQKGQTISIVLNAFCEATAIYGLMLVLLGCSYATMIPYVVVAMISLIVVRPSLEFFERVEKRLEELEDNK